MTLLFMFCQRKQTQIISVKLNGHYTGWVKCNGVVPGRSSQSCLHLCNGSGCVEDVTLKLVLEELSRDSPDSKVGKDLLLPSKVSCEIQTGAWHSFAPKIPMNPHYLKKKKAQILGAHYFKSFIIMCWSIWSFPSVLEGSFSAQERLFVILLDFQINIWHITDPT